MKYITRKEAMKLGEEYYHQGRACPAGHKGPRFTYGDLSTHKRRGKCVLCWRIEHPEEAYPAGREDLGVIGQYF